MAKAKAPMVQEGSAHLDNKQKMTKASGEHKHHGGTLMEGIVTGLTKKISPPIVDGIVRGIARHGHQGMDGQVSSVHSSSTTNTKGAFGAGNFPEGAR